MIWFVFGLIFGLAALIGFAVAAFAREMESKAVGGVLGAIAGVICIGMLFGSATREVPAREVGVPVSVGHIGQTMTPGLHFFQPPWEKVNLISEKYQTQYYDGKNCIQVRIGGQQLACWQGSIQYRVKDSAAPGLFNSYGNTGNIMAEIGSAVVYRNLYAALTHTFSDYNPIVDVSKNFQAGDSQFTKLQPTLLTDVNHLIGGRIDVTSLLMKNMIYNDNTQHVLEGIQQQQGKTAQAKEAILTNEAQNEANSKLSKSDLSPSVLVNNCLQLTQEAITNRYSLPVGWNCTGGQANLALSGK